MCHFPLSKLISNFVTCVEVDYCSFFLISVLTFTAAFNHAQTDIRSYYLLAYEEAEERARQARDGVRFSAMTVRNATTRELEKALRWIRDEIRLREKE